MNHLQNIFNTIKANLSERGNSAWRPRVDAELDPGGRVKELIGIGSNTLRARLATVRARLDV